MSERMQQAVDVLRGGGTGLPKDLAEAVADVLRGEIVMWGEMEAFVGMFDAAIQHASGAKSTLRLGRRPDGAVAMHLDNSDCTVRLAEAILNLPDKLEEKS